MTGSAPTLAERLRAKAQVGAARMVEAISLPLDKALVRRTTLLHRIPGVGNRRGGKLAYGEWCWLIGMLQAVIHDLVGDVEQPRIVDVGCGTGLAMIAAEPFAADGGEIIGLDVRQDDIDFCRGHYPNPPYRFERIDYGNDLYAPAARCAEAAGPTWPVESGSADLVTAISVWTHLRQADAVASLSEAARVLRPGGHAVVSLFVVDIDGAQAGRTGDAASDAIATFHRSPGPLRFERPLGDGWFTTSWAEPPERAIAVTTGAFERAAANAGLEVVRWIPGTWPGRSGLYYQDMVVLRR